MPSLLRYSLALFVIGCYPIFSYLSASAEKRPQPQQHSKITAETSAGYIKTIDGDTIRVKFNGKTEHLRLIGIDAPEKEDNKKSRRDAERTGRDVRTIMQLGEKAKTHLTTLLSKSSTLRIEFDVERRDHYGRLLGYIFLPDGQFVNKKMLQDGFASPMSVPPNVKYRDDFLRTAQVAREKKLGLWGF
jgi:micrococcal nuclease